MTARLADRLPRVPRRGLVVALLFALPIGSALLPRPEGQAALLRSVAVGRGPSALAIDARTARVFVANGDDATVSMLDARSGNLLRTIAVGRDPDAVAVDERTNRVLVVNGNFAGQGSVSVLDARSGDLLRTVAVQDSPWAIAVDEHTARAFVANGAAASVSVLDARSGRLLRTVAVGQRPVAITVDELTQHAFVVNSGPYPYADTTGTVSVLDTRTGAVVTAVVVGQEPSAVAVDSRHGRVAVTNTGSDSVSLLDARSGDLLHTVMVGLAPMIVGADAWRGHAFIVNEDDGTMSVLDTQNGTVLHTVRVDRRMAGSPLPPYAIALDEAHNRVYVSTWGRLDRAGMPRGNGMLHVFDARNGAPIQTIAVGVSPVAMAVDQRMEQVFIVFADGLAPRRRPWWAPVTQPLRRWLPWLPSQASSSQRMPGSVSILDNRRI